MVKARPRDRDAKEKFTQCRNMVRRLAFERAIAVDDSTGGSVADSIDIDSMSKPAPDCNGLRCTPLRRKQGARERPDFIVT